MASATTTAAGKGTPECASPASSTLDFCMEWNAEGQLKRVTLNGNEVARFAYDPNGRRVEKVAGGVTTTYLYEGEQMLRGVRGGSTYNCLNGPGPEEASILLHEMGHLARRSGHDDDHTPAAQGFFKRCTVGCSRPRYN